jgi:GNAT superfamily N-acetyltransferase
MTEPAHFTLAEAQSEDAPAIATIHITSRLQAMPYLQRPHTDDETRNYFARVVADRPQAWWVVRHFGQVVAYMLIDGENLDHLYVAPRWQGRGFGSALLDRAKALSPGRLVLWAFQRNERARAFYEARGFRSIKQTDGENEECEPDVQYEWKAP